MQTSSAPTRWAIALILTVGILAVSTAAVFIRLALDAADQRGVGFSLVLAAMRMGIAALMLVPTWRSFHPGQIQRRSLLYSMVAGVCLAIHFASWITSLSYTSIAASTTLVTTSPIWVALLSWWIWRERPTGLTSVGIGVAIAGSAVIGLSDLGVASPGQHPLLGNALALIGSWAVSAYFLLSREAQRNGVSTQHHVAITYSLAALVLIPMPWLAHTSYLGYSPRVYVYISLMALFPQVIGHTSLNWAVRWMSPTLVTLVILAEPVGAGLLGLVIFQEYPGPMVLLGAMILLSGVAIAAIGNQDRPSMPSSP
ncbi:MAG: DMT family transporter [Elainellaceae cyanobacterium]